MRGKGHYAMIPFYGIGGTGYEFQQPTEIGRFRSSGGWQDKESRRWCKRCGHHWRKDPSDPNRCRECFAPRHESMVILADAIDDQFGCRLVPLGAFVESGNAEEVNPNRGYGRQIRTSLARSRKEWLEAEAKREQQHQRLNRS